MHVLIPYAFADAPGCRQALSALRLPGLERMLRRLQVRARHAGSDQDLSPPHEKALARLGGLPQEDGRIALAALDLAHSGSDPGSQTWAWITPAHWQPGADHIRMHDPGRLQLDEAQSRELLAALAPYFAEDGMELGYQRPDRWLAKGAPLAGLSCASVDRVLDADVSPWMPSSAKMRRLQNEMQMLLYAHPVNDARSAGGQAIVNSFWISGCGALDAHCKPNPPPLVADGLRLGALTGDWAAWSQAWSQVEQTVCQHLEAPLDAGAPCTLTLCSTRHALELEPAADGWMARLRQRFKPARLHDFTDQL